MNDFFFFFFFFIIKSLKIFFFFAKLENFDFFMCFYFQMHQKLFNFVYIVWKIFWTILDFEVFFFGRYGIFFCYPVLKVVQSKTSSLSVPKLFRNEPNLVHQTDQNHWGDRKELVLVSWSQKCWSKRFSSYFYIFLWTSPKRTKPLSKNIPTHNKSFL